MQENVHSVHYMPLYEEECCVSQCVLYMFGEHTHTKNLLSLSSSRPPLSGSVPVNGWQERREGVERRRKREELKEEEAERRAHRGTAVNKEEDAGLTSIGDKNNLRARKRPNVCLSCRPL